MAEKKTIQTLAVDIGGSGIKVMVLDEKGNPITERDRVDTPQPAKPEPMLAAIVALAQGKEFDRVSVGFPGVVKAGITKTAANVDSEWIDFDLATVLSQRLHKPVRVINDADMQGLGAISGKGLELVITLGTGVGGALFLDGKLIPNLEPGHHEFRKGDTYEQQLGNAALELAGKKKWNERVTKAIASLEHLFNYDTLYLGGGNAKFIAFELPHNAKIVPNISGLLGGIALWRES
ncbi:MAG: ROK family protein [Tildeniella nuda ZEHNDER 1965/U140]|jgi:polyphosphate glucokinase|nr:ROK family protein [Tildeniella nuda ZEHNDER 1965/U140]